MNVDSSVAETAEKLRSDSGVGPHPDADDTELSDPASGGHAAAAQLRSQRAQNLLRGR